MRACTLGGAEEGLLRVSAVALVHAGCCHRAPQTESLINSGRSFLTDPEAETFKIKAPADSSSRSRRQQILVRTSFLVRL